MRLDRRNPFITNAAAIQSGHSNNTQLNDGEGFAVITSTPALVLRAGETGFHRNVGFNQAVLRVTSRKDFPFQLLSRTLRGESGAIRRSPLG
jgi:hypothetical protein